MGTEGHNTIRVQVYSIVRGLPQSTRGGHGTSAPVMVTIWQLHLPDVGGASGIV